MKAIKRKNAYGMGGTFDQPGYEYDAVNDTFKDLETGKVFSKEYVAPTGGASTGTSTVKLETNKQVSITENGEVEITPTSGKDAMEKVTANVAVPVPVLEDNKAASIDVSQYTEPVEITPTEGKDGMEKTTVTLNNVPSGSATAYYWSGNSGQIKYNTNFDKAPATSEEFAQSKYVEDESGRLVVYTFDESVMTDYTKVNDTEFTAKWDGDLYTFVRNPSYDCTLWGN